MFKEREWEESVLGEKKTKNNLQKSIAKEQPKYKHNDNRTES